MTFSFTGIPMKLMWSSQGFLQIIELPRQKNQTQLCSLPVKIQTTCWTDRPIPQQIIYKMRWWQMLNMLSVVKKVFTPSIYFIVNGPQKKAKSSLKRHWIKSVLNLNIFIEKSVRFLPQDIWVSEEALQCMNVNFCAETRNGCIVTDIISSVCCNLNKYYFNLSGYRLVDSASSQNLSTTWLHRRAYNSCASLVCAKL